MNVSDVLLLYAFLVLGISVMAELYAIYRERMFRWELSRSRLWRCQDCDRVFLAKRLAPVARCPRCNGVSTAFI